MMAAKLYFSKHRNDYNFSINYRISFHGSYIRIILAIVIFTLVQISANASENLLKFFVEVYLKCLRLSAREKFRPRASTPQNSYFLSECVTSVTFM